LSNDFSSKKFDEFLGIKSPYFYENKKRAMQINLPIKWHKHSLKFSSWHRKKSIQVKKINDNFYVNFFYEKEDVKQKEKGNSIAFDIGYIKLLSDSNGNFYGKELKELYDKISKKKQGSKNFKQLLVHRDNEINRTINQIDLSNINLVIVEDLKNLFYKTKLSHKQMRKIQRMTYRKALNKLELVCQEKGIRIEKVSPSYSSQTCSKCGTIDKDSRNRELFQCASCNETLDADTNAARVLLHKGVYNPSNTKNNLSIFNGKL
jgi:putative transposase